MKKLIVFGLLMAATLSWASIKGDFQQFDPSAIHGYSRTGQNWDPAKMITVSVKANTSVWIAGFVSNWYDVAEPETVSMRYDMSAGKYGYIPVQHNTLVKENVNNGWPVINEYLTPDGQTVYEPVTPAGAAVMSGDGTSTQVTFHNDQWSTPDPVLTAYHLGTFTKDTEFFLVLTTEAGEQVDSYSEINPEGSAADGQTSLGSRQIFEKDQAGNVRFNFGFRSSAWGGNARSREFILVYGPSAETPVTGQPLPGMVMAGLLSMGTVAAGRRLRKRTR